MLYLVTGTVSVKRYMGNSTTHDEMRLVEAETPDEARLKFDKHWEDKTDPYSIYYHTTSCTVLETIR